MIDKYEDVMDWLNIYGWMIGGALLSFVIAVVRTAKDKEADLLEALFCALITLGLSSVLMWLNMPLMLSMFIGAFIGGLGSQYAQSKMKAQVEEKLSGGLQDQIARAVEEALKNRDKP